MSPRGGARNGTPGKAYANRSDLTPTAAPGQTYGQAGAQLSAQQAMPMGAQPGPSGPPPAPSAGPPVAPGSLGAFDGPTQRPNEPVTAGADAGPGPGSEILGLPSTQPNPDIERILPALPLLERIASDPSASAGTRIFYRTLLLEKMRRSNGMA